MCFYDNVHRLLLAIFKRKSRVGVGFFSLEIRAIEEVSVRYFLTVLYLFLIKTWASTEIANSHSMSILNTRDVRAARFESSASNDKRNEYLKSAFVNISRIVGSSRGTLCIIFT